MATWDFTGAGTGSSTAFPETRKAVMVLRNSYDLNDKGAQGYGDVFASGDTIKWFNVEAGWLVLSATLNAVAAGTTSSTLTLADTTLGTTYLGATSVATTGQKLTAWTLGTNAYILYTAADVIKSVVGTANQSAGIVEVAMLVVDHSYKAPALPGKI